MKEHVSQQSPPLTRQREGSIVGAETHHHFAVEIHHRTAGERHREKDRDIGAEQYVSDSDAGFAPDPGSGDDRLPRLLDLFATLSRLMLHTAPTNLSSKRQRRQLPPTSNASRHRLIKEYQQSASFGRWVSSYGKSVFGWVWGKDLWEGLQPCRSESQTMIRALALQC